MKTYRDFAADVQEAYRECGARVIVEALEACVRRHAKEVLEDLRSSFPEARPGVRQGLSDLLKSLEQDANRLEIVTHVLEN